MLIRGEKHSSMLIFTQSTNNMRQAILIHNPTAGSGEHLKKDLIDKIESEGYQVKYYSTDLPGWERFTRRKADVIFVAGGDGTVQKLAKELLNAGSPMQKIPVQILPLGTANNIAKTLNLNLPLEKFMKLENIVEFDAGEVKGAGEAKFFVEALGFGIFPKLVKVMKDRKEKEGEPEDPDEELEQSLQELLRIVKSYEAQETIIIADGEEIAGRFLLVELMNVRFIGPNLELAPGADTGDGSFELIAVPEDARKQLEDYVRGLMSRNNKKSLENFSVFRKVQQVRIKWFGEDMHVDDERIEDKSGEEIQVKNNKATFNFHSS